MIRLQARWPAQWLGVFFVAYGAALGTLAASGSALEDVIETGLLLGIVLPLVASLACLDMPEPTAPAAWRRGEGRLMFVLLDWVTVFLALRCSRP